MSKSKDELLGTEREFFTPEEVSGVLGASAQVLRVTAREKPELVGFPFTFIGSCMKIPRIPFLKFMGYLP